MANSTVSHQVANTATDGRPIGDSLSRRPTWPPFDSSPGPYWPPMEDWLNWLLSLSAGELHGKIMREYMNRYEECGRDKKRFMRYNAEKLAAQIHIPAAELQQLFIIIDLVFEVDKKPSNTDAIEKVRRIHQSMIDQNASQITTTISAIAVDSTSNVEARGPIAVADLEGAFIGAEVGVWGAGVGAVPGAIIGAGLFSLAAWW